MYWGQVWRASLSSPSNNKPTHLGFHCSMNTWLLAIALTFHPLTSYSHASSLRAFVFPQTLLCQSKTQIAILLVVRGRREGSLAMGPVGADILHLLLRLFSPFMLPIMLLPIMLLSVAIPPHPRCKGPELVCIVWFLSLKCSLSVFGGKDLVFLLPKRPLSLQVSAFGGRGDTNLEEPQGTVIKQSSAEAQKKN